jgi:allantoin racemase
LSGQLFRVGTWGLPTGTLDPPRPDHGEEELQIGRRLLRIGLIGSTSEAGQAAAPELSALTASKADLIGYPSRVGVFPFTPLERLIDAAMTAAEEGCAAVVIDSLGDYGLSAMRAALSVQAVGAGEAGMAAAAAGGRVFTVVTVWPSSMNFIVERLLREYGHSQACRCIINIGEPSDLAGPGETAAYLSRIKQGDNGIVSLALEAIATAAEDGAEAVLLGCTCMSPIADEIANSAPVPVINPLAAAVLAALEAGPIDPPELRPGRRETMRKMVDAIADEPADACPVCVVGAEL